MRRYIARVPPCVRGSHLGGDDLWHTRIPAATGRCGAIAAAAVSNLLRRPAVLAQRPQRPLRRPKGPLAPAGFCLMFARTLPACTVHRAGFSCPSHKARPGADDDRRFHRQRESVTMIPSDYLAICDEQSGTTCVLRLRGELDVCSRDGLRAAISSAFKRCPRTLVLDLSALEFIDCSGLSVLIWAHNLLEADRRQLLITGCPPAARRLIRLTGADQYLHLCPAHARHTASREAMRPRNRSGIGCRSSDAFRSADRSAPGPA